MKGWTHLNKINPINDRIVNEILKGKQEINYNKEIRKDDENLKGNFNKVIGNLTSMTLRKYIINIINYYGLNFKVSNVNSFIKGCPTEWDLIILNEKAKDVNNTNVFEAEEVITVLEFKTSGLLLVQYKNIEKTFELQFNYLNHFNKEHIKKITFAYITFAETEEYFARTKKYFDLKNNKLNTAFAFLEYDLLVKKDEKHYINECLDFKKFLFGILNQD